MGNDLKTRSRYTTTIKKELLEAIKQHAEDTDIPLSRHFDRALRMYLESEVGIDWEEKLIAKKATPLD